VLNDQKLMISGTTDTFNSVDEMKNRMEPAHIFKKVTISSVNKDRSGNRVRFKMQVEL